MIIILLQINKPHTHIETAYVQLEQTVYNWVGSKASELHFEGATMGCIRDPPAHTYAFNMYTEFVVNIGFILLNVRFEYSIINKYLNCPSILFTTLKGIATITITSRDEQNEMY